MKKIFASFALMFAVATANAQTTATNFTASDCSSVSHTLFTELDAGKVVVLVWVMPCGSCISDAKAGYDAAQSFATTNPGKVLYWLVDDAGNTSCSSLTSWASTNSIGPTGLVSFGNAGNTINETNYGGTGMPHVVVMAGTNHHIYYDKKNGSSDGVAITSAINSGITATGVAQVAQSNSDVKLFPNPAKDKIAISYHLENAATVSMEVYDITGKQVKSVQLGEQLSGQHSFDMNLGRQLSNGTYFLKVNTNNTSAAIRFTIAD